MRQASFREMVHSWEGNRFASGRTAVVLEAGLMVAMKYRCALFLSPGAQARTGALAGGGCRNAIWESRQ